LGAATAAALVRPSSAGRAASAGQFITDFVASTALMLLLFGGLPAALVPGGEQQGQQEQRELQ
jgi:hypothetical protein